MADLSHPKTPRQASPAPVRVARATAQGKPAAAEDPPPEAAAGGKKSPESRERAPSGMPSPEAGAELSSQRNAPARGRARSPRAPAGGALDADGASSDRSRITAGVSLADLHAAAMSERELENGIRAILADLPSLRWYHTHDSRRSPSGFPDLVIVGDGVIYRELKTAKGKVSDAQAEWLHALVLAGQDACVWRPADLLSGLIGRRLAALAGLRGAA